MQMGKKKSEKKLREKLRAAVDKTVGAAELDTARSFFMTVTAADGVSIAGRLNITDYSDGEIRIDCDGIVLVLRGSHFALSDYSTKNTSVAGIVDAIIFERGGAE